MTCFLSYTRVSVGYKVELSEGQGVLMHCDSSV